MTSEFAGDLAGSFGCGAEFKNLFTQLIANRREWFARGDYGFARVWRKHGVAGDITKILRMSAEKTAQAGSDRPSFAGRAVTMNSFKMAEIVLLNALIIEFNKLFNGLKNRQAVQINSGAHNCTQNKIFR